jgi:hypothetical protein
MTYEAGGAQGRSRTTDTLIFTVRIFVASEFLHPAGVAMLRAPLALKSGARCRMQNGAESASGRASPDGLGPEFKIASPRAASRSGWAARLPPMASLSSRRL